MIAKKPLHCYLVPAFKESAYLRSCLDSLIAQRTPSPIIISTSTPFRGIEDLATEFNAELVIHDHNKGIAHDWNQGLATVAAEWVTLAHQDDVYLPEYSTRVLDAIDSVRDATLVFTDYSEISYEGTLRVKSRLLKIKKILLELGFLGRRSIYGYTSKANVLRFGNPIPCPAVTFRTGSDPGLFSESFRLNMDWAAWLVKAKASGSFVWIREPLMYHRIHSESETSAGINLGYRRDEDLAILEQLWPKHIARFLVATYSIAYRNNNH